MITYELVCLCLLSTSVPLGTRVYNVSSPQDSIAVRGFVFGDLLGSTTYIILLSAVNVAGVSPVRESFPFTTLAPVLPTAPVSGLSVSMGFTKAQRVPQWWGVRGWEGWDRWASGCIRVRGL